MRFCLFAALCGLAIAGMALGEPPHASGGTGVAEFGPPEVILEGSKDGTRLYPLYADFDRDGKIDQVVGVNDRLRVYRNQGTNAIPEYAKPVWLDEVEPSASIPAG